MGLAERRAVKLFQENTFPKLRDEINKAAGFEVNFEIDWDSLAVDEHDHYHTMYEDSFPKIFFQPLKEAIKAIAVDDLGKDALKSGLKKVIIRYSGTTDYSFKAGTLTMDYHPLSNVDYWQDRKEQVQKSLEKGL